MPVSRLARAPRQAAILATIAGLHVGAFLIVVAGLVPRLEWLAPSPPPIMALPPKLPAPSTEAPRPPGPVDYSPPRLPLPDVPIPEFDGAAALYIVARAPAEAGAGSGPILPVPDTRAPALRTQDGRLAALVGACYPAASRRLAEEGRVMVRVDIDARGRASGWSIVESSGFARLDAAVNCVIRRLDFVPGRRDGEPVAASATLPIVFRLD